MSERRHYWIPMGEDDFTCRYCLPVRSQINTQEGWTCPGWWFNA